MFFRRLALAIAMISLLAGSLAAQEIDAAHSVGSTYVPLDSWVYPAMDRLAALGYLPTASMGMRPWTRLECARLVRKTDSAVASAVPSTSMSNESLSLIENLRAELAPELGELAGTEAARVD